MLDDAIILAIALIVLPRFGIHIPLWIIILAAVLFIGWTIVSYLVFWRRPQLGFENMIGTAGITVEALSPGGTVRIGHEIWAAKARDGRIGPGIAVEAVGQNGLILTVATKTRISETKNNS